jgi:hypothetical protein
VDELLGIIKEKLWGKNSSLEDIKRAALYLAVATKVVHPDTSALLESIYNEIEGYLNTHSPDATTQKYLVFWVTFNRVYTKFFVWINSIKLLANEPYTAAVNKLQSSTDRKEQDLARKLIVQMYEAGHETAIHDLDTGMAQMISELDDNANSRSVYITNWECIVAWHEAGLKPAMQFINQVINEKKDPSNQARLRYRDYS